MTKKLKYDPNIQLLQELDQHLPIKIACVSDTHMLKPKLNSAADLIIHAGDIFNYNSNESHLPLMQDYF